MTATKTNEINVFSDAYNTGCEASRQGEPRSANPYCRGTVDYANWLAGWKDADFAMIRAWTRSVDAYRNG